MNPQHREAVPSVALHLFQELLSGVKHSFRS